MATLYSILNAETKRWWYHQQLRRHGKNSEARKRERQSIKSTIKLLRNVKANGGYISIGRGGATIQGHNVTQSGGHPDYYRAIARAINIPFKDTRNVEFNIAAKIAISGPMISVGETPEKRISPLSYAPLDYVFGLWADAGAEIENWKDKGEST